MAFKKLPNIEFENAKIIYRNFAGEKTEYNRNGDRSFCVVIDDNDLAQRLADDGWNVKIRVPRTEDESVLSYLQVAVSFKVMPPEIMVITKRGKRAITEETVDDLDRIEIRSVDLIIRPYNWTIQEGTKNEKSGVKAYLKEMYVVPEESRLAEKYAPHEEV